MKQLIAVLTGLFILGCSVSVEAAPLGNPFLRGLKNPAELAVLLEKSLALDETGESPVSPEQCAKRHYCARPIDFLEAFQQIDTGAGLKTLGELPNYVESLVPVHGLTGSYWSWCIKTPTKSSKFGKPLRQCESRPFKKGEAGWKNPVTGKVVMMQDCANPIDGPDLAKNCVFIHFRTKEGDTAVRLKQYGPTDLSSDECTGLKRAGEKNFESPFVEECADEWCSFEHIDQVLGASGWQKGSFTPTPGEHVLRLPAKVAEADSKYRMVFCLDRWDRSNNAALAHPPSSNEEAFLQQGIFEDYVQRHSCGIGVRWFDYLPTKDTKIATIYYDDKALARANAKTVTGESAETRWIFGGQCF